MEGKCSVICKKIMKENLEPLKLLEFFSKELKADSFMFQKFSNANGNTEFIFKYNLIEETVEKLNKEILCDLSFKNLLKDLKEGELLKGNDLKEKAYFKEFLKRNSLKDIKILGVFKNEEYGFNLFLFRKKSFKRGDDSFYKDSFKFLRMVLIFLIELEKKESLIEDLKIFLNLEGKGILLFDEKMKLLYSNKIAELILKEGDGVRIGKEGLEINDSVKSIQLKDDLRKFLILNDFSKKSQIFAIQRSNRKNLIIHFFYIFSFGPLAGSTKRILVVLYDPFLSPLPDSMLLKKTFNFTKQETNIALMFANGMDLKDISNRLNISLHTVRTHLKHIYKKTNTEKQAALIKLLLTLLLNHY